MPGVPSSRGCEACRKRKKKCNLARPSCSRCTRLNIPCVGSGQQRYKFAPGVTTAGPGEALVGLTASTSHSSTAPSSFIIGFTEPSRPLYNEVTIACGAFVSTLVVSDPRYDVSNLGGFLQYIPQRLGRNKALDLCARAFTGAMASARSGKITVQALTDYGSGMKAVRASLTSPETAKTAETLVATYLLSMCQAYLTETHEHYWIHMHGLATLVEQASLEEWRDPFHGEVLISAAFGVVFASISEPTLKLSPSIIDVSKRVYGPDPDPLFIHGVETTSLRLENLVRYPLYAQEPEVRLAEIESSYGTMIIEARRVAKFVNDFIATADTKDSPLLTLEGPTSLLLKTYFAYEGINMILLALVFMFNKFLRLSDPHNFSLFEDADFLSTECLKAGKRSYKFKPLGASLTPMALGVVWASTAEVAKKVEAAGLLDEFKDDLLGSKFVKLAVQLEARYRYVGKKLGVSVDDESNLGEKHGGSSPGWIEASKTSGDAAGCCVM